MVCPPGPHHLHARYFDHHRTMKNPIIEEVREAQAALAAEHGYDLQRIHEWAKAAQEAREKARRKIAPGKGASGTTPKKEKAPSKSEE